MAFVICAVCARRQRQTIANAKSFSITEIPNGHRLVPDYTHVAHELRNGMLLEPSGIVCDGSSEKAIICGNCITALRSSSASPPRYSLANGLWVGDCPPVIRRLSIPELFLIARKFPRIYVIKLYAKTRRGHPETQQRALKGNVTTFDLNMEKIGQMLTGHLMPQLPEILCLVLSVCYVGSQPLSRDSLHSTFCVHREAVAQALSWLRIHNPKYYGDITLDCSRLGSLPLDGVPDEILATIRQDTVADHVELEEDGYVPDGDIWSVLSFATLYSCQHSSIQFM